jgi:hypothetical protein
MDGLARYDRVFIPASAINTGKAKSSNGVQAPAPSANSNDNITFYLRIFRHLQGRELKALPAPVHVSPSGSYFASAFSSLITNIDVFMSCPLASR